MLRAGFLVIVVTAYGCRSDAGKPDERVATLIATAEVQGTPEPCGCSSDPLGDVARISPLARGGLWLDAGSLLYDEVPASSPSRVQSDLKAQKLASIYKDAELGLGVNDLSRGGAAITQARHADNVAAGVERAPPRVRLVDGVKVGVFGVVTPKRVAASGLQAGDPVAAATAAVAKLKADGAQVIVALLGMNRDEARTLMTAVDGIGFGIIGAEVGEGMPEAEPVKGGFLVAPADQARRVVRIELHAKKGVVALTPFAGEAARQVTLERQQRKVKTLTLQLAGWKGDPHADKAFVAAREKELAEVSADKTRLEKERPVPPDASYFTYALEPVRVALPRDPKVAGELRALAHEIGQRNFSAARDLPPPPAEAGKPSYVGMAACGKCHKAAVAFWQKTVHAQAWKTLVDVDKQYNYDCISCHVTGWLRPGGSNLGSVEKQALLNVQCEVCHGPGSKHVAEEGMDEPKTILARPADRLCADQCHTKEHSDTFQLDPYLRDILGKGHGEARRKQLGDGVTGHELRSKALAAAGNQ